MNPQIGRYTTGIFHGMISFPSLSAFAVGALLAAGAATAAGGNAADAQARYKQERAACIAGQADQDRATCLREAAAALEAAKRGRLGDGKAPYERNRLIRCERLPEADRKDCVRRMHGEGSVSGSVESGGIYRELRTMVPAQ